MGKFNKNIKPLVKKASEKCTKITAMVKTTVDRSKLMLKPKDDQSKLLLHKTITPKKITSKKEKIRQKRKNLLNKFALLKKQRKEEIARKNRQKTAVIGDLKPLKDALPSLDELFQISRENIKTGVEKFDSPEGAGNKLKNIKNKIKNKKNKFISQVNSYQALLKDPDFKKNPRDVIAYHIKYTHGLE